MRAFVVEINWMVRRRKQERAIIRPLVPIFLGSCHKQVLLLLLAHGAASPLPVYAIAPKFTEELLTVQTVVVSKLKDLLYVDC